LLDKAPPALTQSENFADFNMPVISLLRMHYSVTIRAFLSVIPLLWIATPIKAATQHRVTDNTAPESMQLFFGDTLPDVAATVGQIVRITRVTFV
jgi:hypothetical protein